MRLRAPSLFVVVAVVAVPVVLTGSSGCEQDASEPPSLQLVQQKQETATYDGKTLFRGLFLGYGPAAQLVPEIKHHLRLDLFISDPQQRTLVAAGLDGVVNKIHEMDSKFFDRFEERVRSRKHAKIKQALREAAEVTKKAVFALPQAPIYRAVFNEIEKDPENLRKGFTPESNGSLPKLRNDVIDRVANTDCGLGEDPPGAGATTVVVAVVAFIAAVAHTWVAAQSWVFISTVGYVVVATKFWVGTESGGSRTLLEDMVVEGIARNVS